MALGSILKRKYQFKNNVLSVDGFITDLMCDIVFSNTPQEMYGDQVLIIENKEFKILCYELPKNITKTAVKKLVIKHLQENGVAVMDIKID